MIGIDISKDSLDTHYIEPSTKHTLWHKRLPNTPQGLMVLKEMTPPDVPWALEPTGSLSTSLVKWAQDKEQIVLLAPTKRAKSFISSLQNRAKCDRLDARGLALFALSQPLDVYKPKGESVERLDQLLLARKNLSQTLSALSLSASELSHARGALKSVADSAKEQIHKLDKEIEELVKAPEFALVQELDKVPGIGPVTAAAVGSRLVAKSFEKADSFVSYIGLDVKVRQSGKRAGSRSLTKHGDAELRRLLFLCAKSSLRAKNSPFKEQYERELAKGLSTTAALNAVARKMARLCWALHKHDATFEPSRVYSRPPRNDPAQTLD